VGGQKQQDTVEVTSVETKMTKDTPEEPLQLLVKSGRHEKGEDVLNMQG